MTNGEVIEHSFNIKEIHAMAVTIFVVLSDGTELEFKRNWWDAPYKDGTDLGLKRGEKK